MQQPTTVSAMAPSYRTKASYLHKYLKRLTKDITIVSLNGSIGGFVTYNKTNSSYLIEVLYIVLYIVL